MSDTLSESVSIAEIIEKELETDSLVEKMDEQIEEPAVIPSRPTERMSKHAALSRLTGDLDSQLRSLSEQLEHSKRMLTGLVQHVANAEVETRRSDAMEAERHAVSDQLDKLTRQHDRLTAAFTSRTTELAASASRIVQLESEVEEQTFKAAEAQQAAGGLKTDLIRIGNELAHLQDELGRSAGALEEVSATKQGSERALAQLSEKFDRLQESETQNRNKAIELELKNESIGQQLPKLVKENESLRAQLDASEQERATTTTQLAGLKDRSQQALRELEELRKHTASEAYTAKTELEVSLAARRVAERAQAEAEFRASEKEARLQEAEAARRAMAAELNDTRRQTIAAKYEESVAFGKLSELNVRYTSDLMVLDQLREQVKQLQSNLDMVTNENQRLLKSDTGSRSLEPSASRTTTNVTPLSTFDPGEMSVANDRRHRKENAG